MSKLSSKVDERPAMQFYLKDWLADTRILNLAERGLWIDALAFMWRSPERGKLKLQNGCKPDAEAIQNLFGTQDGEAEAIIERLVAKGVASRDSKGVLYCRRMVREATAEDAISKARSRAAHKRWECKDHAKDAPPTPSPTPTPSPVSEGLGTRTPASASPSAPRKATIAKADSDGCYQNFVAAWTAINDRPYTAARKDFVRLADFLKGKGYAADPSQARAVFADLLDTAVKTHEAARQLTNPDKWDRFPDTLAALCQRVNHFTPANLEAVKKRVEGIQEAIRNRARATGEQPSKPRVTITRRLE